MVSIIYWWCILDQQDSILENKSTQNIWDYFDIDDILNAFDVLWNEIIPTIKDETLMNHLKTIIIEILDWFTNVGMQNIYKDNFAPLIPFLWDMLVETTTW